METADTRLQALRLKIATALAEEGAFTEDEITEALAATAEEMKQEGY